MPQKQNYRNQQTLLIGNSQHQVSQFANKKTQNMRPYSKAVFLIFSVQKYTITSMIDITLRERKEHYTNCKWT